MVYKHLCPEFLSKKLLLVDLVKLKPQLEFNEREIMHTIHMQWRAIDSITMLSCVFFSVLKISIGQVQQKNKLLLAGIKLMGVYSAATVVTDYMKVSANFRQFPNQLEKMRQKYEDKLEMTALFGL